MSWKDWTPRPRDYISPELFYQKGTSNKFWRIAVEGRKTYTFYGRVRNDEDVITSGYASGGRGTHIGSETMLEKVHATAAKAKAYALAKYREKVAKGYTPNYRDRVPPKPKRKAPARKPAAPRTSSGTRPLRAVEKRRGCVSCGARKSAKCRTPSGAVSKKPHKGR